MNPIRKILNKWMLIIIILGASSIVIINRASTSPPVNPPRQGNSGFSDNFLVGVLDVGAEDNTSRYQPLNLNLWHQYRQAWVEPQGEHGWTNHAAITNDMLFNPVGDYKDNMVSFLNDLGNNHGMKTLIERPKIVYLSYGARSDYQCESEAFYRQRHNTTNNPPDLWFYTYENHDVGSDMTDHDPVTNEEVDCRYCQHTGNENGANQGYVVKNLSTNREQIEMNGMDWIDDLHHRWLLKPRIRINTADAQSNKLVCRVDIIKWDGISILKSVNLYGNNFLDNNFLYDGKYLEEYYHQSSSDSLAWGPGDMMNPPDEYGHHKSSQDEGCGVDYRIYWYDNCDMWIDYVRVDNEVADELMNPNNPNHNRDNQWIQDEVQQIACASSSPVEFYMEEWEFNQLPCMAYVADKIRYYSQQMGKHFNLMAVLNYCRMIYHVKHYWDHFNEFNAAYVKRNFIDKVGLSEFYYGSYPFYGNSSVDRFNPNLPTYTSKIPNTLPVTSGNAILATAVSPAAYEDWMQQEFDNPENKTGFTSSMKYACDSISKAFNLPFIDIMQTHQWVEGNYTQREPTNEELNCMANLAVSYGAKGLLSFWYENYNYQNIESGNHYGIGLTNDDEQLDPRHDNFYMQYTYGNHSSKFLTMGDISQRLRTWGTYLTDFININSYVYRNETERCDMRTNSYINSLATYHSGIQEQCQTTPCPDPDSPPNQPNLAIDCPDKTYLQVATFLLNAYTYRLYPFFMVVNRRCSPLPDGNRDVQIHFNPQHQKLAGYNNWIIIDLYDGSKQTITLNPNGWVDLGWFGPGEGKLYSMVPVIVGGGSLMSDENVSSSEFLCEDTVFNNGHNITIANNTTIHFTETATIVMNGGTFTAGNSQYSGPPNIIFSPVSGNHFHGLQFNNCEVNVYNSSFNSLYDDTTYGLNMIDCPVIDIRNNAFSFNNQSLVGAINIVYYNSNITPNVYIGANTFSSGTDRE